MAFSLAKDRGLSRCGMKCPHTDRTPMAVQTKGMLDVKDTVLRRELASIALATRKTKNFFRGMLSAFRAGVSVVVGFHKPCCLVIIMLSSVSVAWSDILSSIRRSH